MVAKQQAAMTAAMAADPALVWMRLSCGAVAIWVPPIKCQLSTGTCSVQQSHTTQTLHTALHAVAVTRAITAV